VLLSPPPSPPSRPTFSLRAGRCHEVYTNPGLITGKFYPFSSRSLPSARGSSSCYPLLFQLYASMFIASCYGPPLDSLQSIGERFSSSAPSRRLPFLAFLLVFLQWKMFLSDAGSGTAFGESKRFPFFHLGFHDCFPSLRRVTDRSPPCVLLFPCPFHHPKYLGFSKCTRIRPLIRLLAA